MRQAKGNGSGGLPPASVVRDELAVQRGIILQITLAALSVMGMIGLGVWLVSGGYHENYLTIASFSVAMALLLVVTLFRGIPYSIRAGTLLLMIAIEAAESISRGGIGSASAIYCLTFAILAGILIGPRTGIASLALVIAINAGLGYLEAAGRIHFSALQSGVAAPDEWVGNLLAVTLSGASILGSILQIHHGMSRSLAAQSKLTHDREMEQASLEKRVSERTQELSHKTAQLEAARQVSNKIAAENDIDSILQVAVDVVKEQFSLYYAAIFLTDDKGERAVLRSATGEEGRLMISRNHGLKIGEVGIVGYVVSRGEPRISGNVEDDPVHMKNPLLPETRSEMAVPIKIGDQVMGALDVQSTALYAFPPDDVEVISSIGDQIATALGKAQLVNQLQQTVLELKANYRQTTRQAWATHLKNKRSQYAFRYHQARVESLANRNLGTMPGSEGAKPEIRHLVDPANGQPYTVLAVPIVLRDQTLGVVNMRFNAPRITDEMYSLVESATERLAVSLENVRLLEEIQARAEREKLVGDIANKVRSATDVESILQIAARELGSSLGVSEVVVQLTATN
jgi:GAF domain-containing protein